MSLNTNTDMVMSSVKNFAKNYTESEAEAFSLFVEMIRYKLPSATIEDCEKILFLFKKHKIAKFDHIARCYTYTSGIYLEKDVYLNALSM